MIRFACMFFIIVGSLATAQVADPIEVVRSGTDRVVGVLTDPELAGDENKRARREKVRAIVDEYFGWQRMAQSCLGQHWQRIDDAQKERFVVQFGRLLEATYMDKLDGYSGEQVHYERQQLNSSRTMARVHTSILLQNNQRVSMVYSLHYGDDKWQVYDIMVEGIRLVENYRNQFASVLNNRPFDELLKEIQERVEKLEAQQ